MRRDDRRVYGIGYIIAASDPRTHWPIVLVGLLGKIFGPIGFTAALLRGDVSAALRCNDSYNDLVWWVPFVMILWDAAKHGGDQQSNAASRMRYVKETQNQRPTRGCLRFHASPGALQHLIPPWGKHRGHRICRLAAAWQ